MAFALPKVEDQNPDIHFVFSVETSNPNHPQDQENHRLKAEEPELQQAGMASALPCQQNAETRFTFPDSEPDLVLQNPPVRAPTSLRGCHIKRRKKTVPFLKRQALALKLDRLSKILKPIPFSPDRTVDFSTHEKLLKRIGLWDFVHVEFDRVIRTDLIMQLLVSYNLQTRSRYINGERINVTRAELARALSLPVKNKMNVVEEPVSEEAKAFVEHVVSNWILLQDDTWILPNEVVNWTKVIREGHPEKMDWASLIWFMVDKEVSQGQNLSHCYYASHLQRLIKMHHETLFSTEPVGNTTVKEDDDISKINVCELGDDIEIINNVDHGEIRDENVEMTENAQEPIRPIHRHENENNANASHDENTMLHAIIQDLEDKASNLETLYGTAATNNIEFKEKIAGLEMIISAKNEKIKELQLKVEQKDNKIDELTSKNRSLKRVQSILIDDVEQLKGSSELSSSSRQPSVQKRKIDQLPTC